MLSPGLRQVLESLPSRIPLAVEVLDRSLNVVAPEPGARSLPLLDTTGELRAQLLASITSGRPQTTTQRGRRITIFPMSVAGDRSYTALLAIGADESENGLVEAWGPLLRAAVESDLSAVATTTRQLQQARHLGAVLRFVQHLADANEEAEVLRATIQAAAVWFDLDARVYRRTGAGEFVPHMYLPGAPIVSQRSIPAATIDDIRDVLRISSVADLEALGLSGEGAVLMPLGPPKTADLALVLSGTLPPDIELTFGAITRVAAHLLQRARTRGAADLRKALLTVLADTTTSPQQTLSRALNVVAERCHAASGSVSVRTREEVRTLATVGHAAPSLVPVADGEAHVTMEGDRMAITLPGGPDIWVSVELGRTGNAEFDATTRYAFERGGEVLQAWISGVAASADGRRALLGLARQESPAFLTRIEQEIARAKRFNLNLSVVVVRGPGLLDDATRFERLLRGVRAELRGSDVLGTTSAVEVVALLIQTDSHGGEAVARRLQKRLAREVTLNAGLPAVGHAVFSAECATADALLARARAVEGTPLAAGGSQKD